MKSSTEGIWATLLALGLVMSTPADAWAYVDPGTGSYLFQLAAAGFLAGMFTIRRYWDALKARLRGARADDRTE
jgi:hypothetical protein